VDKITLSVELVNAILGYLGNRPFVEVQMLINAVQKEAEGQFPPAEPVHDAEPAEPAQAQ
jgi:hypothetical protein